MFEGKGKGDLISQLLHGKGGKGKAEIMESMEKLFRGDVSGMSDSDFRATESEKNVRASQGSRRERIARHMELVNSRREAEKTKGQVQNSTFSYERKTIASDTKLGTLCPIKINELQVGQVHHGRVLYCHTITPCHLMSSVMTLVEDADDEIIELAVYNAPCVNRLQSAQRYLPKNRKIAIKEPFFKLRSDGTQGIRIDDPQDLVMDVEMPSSNFGPLPVEDRLAQLVSESPDASKKQLHQKLQEEGFSISLKRVQDLRSKLREDVGEPSTTSRVESGLPESSQQAMDGGGSQGGNSAQLILPKRHPDVHILVYSREARRHRDNGNAAVQTRDYPSAEKAYTKALKVAEREQSMMDEADQEHEGIALWTLFSNRAAARLHLSCPDKALQDALMAHKFAPIEALKPVLRCAEAMAGLCQYSELHSILDRAVEDFPNDEPAFRQKQCDLGPKSTLRVGAREAYKTIMAAVLDAPPGAEILVGPGMYREPLILTKPVTIRSVASLVPTEHWVQGAPEGEIVQVWVSTMHAITMRNIIGGTVCLRGLRIVCDAALERSLHSVEALGGVLVMRNCSMSSTSGPIVGADAGARVIMEHCAVHDGGQGGLIAVNGATLAMSNVFCCRVAASGLELRTGGHAVLHQCSFFSNGRSGIIVWHAAGSCFAWATEVHSNNFESGVLVEENVPTAVFKSCKFYGNGHAGVVVQRKGQVKLQNCEVHSNLEGVLFQSSGSGIIEECDVFENRMNGIFVGFDHIGKAQLIGNKVHNNSKGILLGTGRSDNVTVRKNKEFENNRHPSTEMPPSMRPGAMHLPQMAMDMREWSKNMKKSGGSSKKAADAATEKTYIDTLLEASGIGNFMDQAEQEMVDRALSCGHCKKPQDTQKFLKCSTCNLVNYCSPACQKAHWKLGHKAECKPAPPKYPMFINRGKSVDDKSVDIPHESCPLQ